MEQKNFKALLRRTVVVPVAALAILAAVLLWQIQSLYSAMQWVDHTDQVIGSAQQLMKLIVDMETGVRGYLNTGRDEFLQPYNEAKSSIDSKFDALNQLVSDNPSQQARLAAMRSRFDQWQIDAARAIEGRRGSEEPLYEVDARKQVMDSIRSENDAFVATEQGLRTQRLQTAKYSLRQVILACVLLTLIVSVGLAVFTHRRMRLLGENFQDLLDVAEERAEELSEREASLQSSQAKLQGVVGSAMDAIVSVDEQQRIVVFNQAAETVFQCSASEAVGSTLDRFIPESLREVHHEHLRLFGSAGVTARSMNSPGILTGVRSNGDEFPIEATISQVQAGGEKLYTVILRDITERKRAEAAVQESLERLERVLEVETVGVMFWDLNTGCMVDANDTFLKRMGYSRSDIEARRLTWQKLTPPDYMDVSRAEVEKFLATGRVGPYEKEYFCKDGTRQWLLFAGSSLGNNQCVEFCVDISDRKKAEEALRASEERWSTTLQSIGDAVISTDATGKIDFMNDVAEMLTGWSLPEAKGRELGAIFNIVQEVTRIKPENPVEKVIRLGKVVGLANHTALIKRDGTEIPIEDSGAPIRNREGQIEGVVLVFHDVSEQKKVEKALRNSDRLATTGRLAATIAHEIHNPLDSVGNLLFLIGQGAPENTTREYVSMASQELARVTQLTQQMLTFQREAAKPIPVKIAEILDSVSALYERKIQSAGICLTQQVDFDGHILALPGELRQVFANLVGNAIEAVGSRHGTITLRAYASRDWRSDRPGLRVVVADDGPGIPASVRTSIFEPFFTTKGESGTGLGLWITSDILRKYDGTMRLRSSTQAPHSGTCFSVFFPFEIETDADIQTTNSRVDLGTK